MAHTAANDPVAGRHADRLMPTNLRTYHVFLASPGDVQEERKTVRAFFDRFNRNQAAFRGLRFEVVDWENYSSAGVGRPQELITQQTLERFRPSLALVIGIMAQRFGSPSGTHESGTQEEFEWAVDSWRTRRYPEVKWYFRNVERLQLEADPDKAAAGLDQWRKVKDFRAHMDTMEPRLYTRDFRDVASFAELLDQDLGQWLNAPERPWSAGASGAARPTPADDRLVRLARRLDDAFVEDMRKGEAVEPARAAARYIPLVFRARSTAGRSQPNGALAEGRLEEFLETKRRLLVVGRGGAGKTTTLRHLAAQAAGRALADPQAPVPVYVRLNSFDSRENGLATLLKLISVAMDLEPDQAEQQWRSGERPLLFLFDGLNEVARAHRDTCARALLTVTESPHSRHRYIVTSRPGGPIEDVAAHPTEGSGLVILDLLDLRPEQVKRYLATQGRSDSYERVKPHVAGLASSPFLLWAVIQALGATPLGTVVRSRGGLLRHLIDYFIYEVRERGKAAPRPTTYNYLLVKRPVLARLALRMSTEERTAVPEDLALWQGVLTQMREIEKTYEGIYEFTAETFMPSDRTPVGLLDEAVDNGVLIREAGTLRFLHESVQEYFAAVALCDERPDVLVDRAPDWSPDHYQVRSPTFEVLLTLAGLLDSEAAASFVAALLPRNPVLAAHVVQEAQLQGSTAEMLWNHVAELLDSRHEGRRMLGLQCLVALPGSRHGIVARLLHHLEKRQPYGRELAEQALTRMATGELLRSLVEECLEQSVTLDDDWRADLLQKIGHAQPSDMTRQLLAAWRSRDETGRGRLAELSRHIDATYRFVPIEVGPIQTTLLQVAVDADTDEDSQLAADADQLRSRLRAIPLPKSDFPSADHMRRRMERNQLARERMKALSDHALAGLAASDVAFDRDMALDELVRRGSALAVDRLLDGDTKKDRPTERWWQIASALPGHALADALTKHAISGTPAAARARVILELLEPEPAGSLIDHVLRHEDEGLRTLAAFAARRSPSALDMLAEALRHEPSALVVEAALAGLSIPGEPATTHVLLNMLFRDPLPPRAPSDRDGEMPSLSARGWGTLIHRGLVNQEARTATLDRVRQEIGDPAGWQQAVGEARRWLPDPAAKDLLEHAAQAGDVELAGYADWALASNGDPVAWRRLLRHELEAPPDSFSLVNDILSRGWTSSGDGERLVAEACDVLIPVLEGTDDQRRATALGLAARLSAISTDPALAETAMSVAETLRRSSHATVRAMAIGPLLRLRPKASQLPQWLIDDDDPGVQNAARDAIADDVAQLLLDRLKEAIRRADPQQALRLARLLPNPNQKHYVAELSRELTGTDASQLGTTLVALEMVSTGLYDKAFASLKDQVLEVLNGGFDPDAWRLYCHSTASLSERRLGVAVLAGIHDTGNFEFLAALAKEAARNRPADLDPLWHLTWADLELGRTEQARAGFRRLADEKPTDINHIGLAVAFSKLNDPNAALRHARMALEQDDQSFDAHFLVGWYTYVTGEVEASIELTRRAVELDPAEPAAHANLALALLNLGRGKEAWPSYRRFAAIVRRLDTDPAIEQIDEALVDLETLTGVSTVDADVVAPVRALLEETREHVTSAS